MRKRGLLDVRRFIIPANVLDPTLEVLSIAGSEGYEAFVVWGGVREEEGATLRFKAAYKPSQKSYRTERGLFVQVEGEALFELNRIFNNNGLILAGQAHSHPTDAYHSDADDHMPLVTLLGGLSVVIPDFALGGLSDLSRFSWFRLAAYENWTEINEETKIEIES